MTPVEFRGDLWLQKTRVPGLSCGVVSRTPTCDGRTDRQTDTQTDGRRAMASTADAKHRAVKMGAVGFVRAMVVVSPTRAATSQKAHP